MVTVIIPISIHGKDADGRPGAPDPNALEKWELAFNEDDANLYIKRENGTVYGFPVESLQKASPTSAIAGNSENKYMDANLVRIAIAANSPILQTVFEENSNVSSGVGRMFFDDSIPQQSEGVEFMTASITPQRDSSWLLVECCALVSEGTNTTNAVAGALFRDDADDAIAATLSLNSSESAGGEFGFTYSGINHDLIQIATKVPSIATTPTTIKFRAGINNLTPLYFNQFSQISRVFGGAIKSWIKITEIL